MNVTLFALNASFVHTNLAVRCIGKNLKSRGHTVTVLERSLKDRRREVLHALAASEADVYGFSVYIWNRGEMLAFAADLHELRPLAKIVLGGPEISYEDNTFFDAHPYIDNIIAGEGEAAFADLCDCPPRRHTVLMAAPFAGFADAGILYDEFPPDSHSGGILYYESSRGCPYNCAYCLSSATRGVRAKSAEVTIRELRRFEAMEGVRVIKFVDRTFNFDRRRANAILRAIAGEGFTKTYHFEICADLLDEESFQILAAMPKGRIQLECGVQSTNPETLAAIGRTSDPDRIIAALARMRAVGNIHIHADLIAGLPHENITRFARSFDALYPACDLLQLGFLKLIPGTLLRAQCGEMGYRYSARPPYEVLQSDALSYADLYRLHAVDDVLDRFGGSGHFAHTLRWLLDGHPSPFAFFDGLAAAMPSPRCLSQRAAFLAFRKYARTVTRELSLLDAYLTLDWYLWEGCALPSDIIEYRDPDEAAIRRAWCDAHPGVHPSTVIVRRLAFASDVPTVIDRTGRTYEILR